MYNNTLHFHLVRDQRMENTQKQMNAQAGSYGARTLILPGKKKLAQMHVKLK